MYQQKRINSRCKRCGLTHQLGHCHAWNVKCSRCRWNGHYARMCTMKAIPKEKSNRTKQRDYSRMTTFIRRKALESFPFHGLDNDELSTCFDKYQCMKDGFRYCMQVNEEAATEFEQRLYELEVQHKELQNSLQNEQRRRLAMEQDKNRTEYDIEKLQSQLDSMSAQNDELKLEKSNLVAENRALTSKVQIQNDEWKLEKSGNRSLILKVQAQNDKLKLHKSNLVADKRALTSKVKESETEIDKLNIQIKQIGDDMNHKMEYAKYQLEIAKDQFDNFCHLIKDSCREDLSVLLGDLYRSYNVRPPRHCKAFNCRKCGSNVYHHPQSCWANSSDCRVCGKPHLTAVCDYDMTALLNIGDSTTSPFS